MPHFAPGVVADDVLDALPIAVYKAGPEGLRYANDAFFSLLGITRHTGVGDAWRAAIHPDDRARIEQVVAEARRSRVPFDTLTFRVGGLGTIVRHLLARSVWSREDGAYFGTLEDVTDLVVSRDRTGAAEARWRLLLDSLPVGVFQADADGPRFFNRRFRTIFELSADEDVSHRWLERVHPDDRDAMRLAVKALRVKGRVFEPRTFRVVRSDGELMYVLVSVQLLGRDLSSGYTGTVKDVTNLERARARAAAAEDAWARLLESAPVGVIIADGEGNLKYANDAWFDLVGLEPCPIDQVDWRATMHEDDLPVALAARFDAVARGEPGWEVKVRVRRPDGVLRHVLARADALGNGDYVSAVWDVTEAVEAERRKLADAERLSEFQRLEALGLLAGGIAHDMNNLLTVILGNNELAQLATATDPETQILLGEVERAGRAAAELADGMLSFTGKKVIKRGPVDVPTVVREAALLVSAGHAHDCVILLDRVEQGAIIGDLSQVRQIVMNLLTNAAQSSAAAPVTIAVRVETLEGPDGGTVVVEVQDNGAGMDAETRRRMFDPFFSTKELGSGLGLATVRGLVAGHGGTVDVRSAPGAGTTMIVRLPAAPAGSTPVPVPPTPRPVPTLSGRVLVVDDSPAVTAITVAFLERAGMEVETAGDGETGLRLVEQRPDSYAVVVLDVTMPWVDGLTVCQRLETLCPGIPVVLVSGYAAEDFEGRLPHGPTIAFLQKPWLPVDLYEAIVRVTHPPGR